MSVPNPMAKSNRSTSASDAGTKPASFESALSELEQLVAKLEGGKLSLEEALAAHQRGLVLARHCQSQLEAAQQQVRVLEGEILKPLPDSDRDARDDD